MKRQIMGFVFVLALLAIPASLMAQAGGGDSGAGGGCVDCAEEMNDQFDEAEQAYEECVANNGWFCYATLTLEDGRIQAEFFLCLVDPCEAEARLNSPPTPWNDPRAPHWATLGIPINA